MAQIAGCKGKGRHHLHGTAFLFWFVYGRSVGSAWHLIALSAIIPLLRNAYLIPFSQAGFHHLA